MCILCNRIIIEKLDHLTNNVSFQRFQFHSSSQFKCPTISQIILPSDFCLKIRIYILVWNGSKWWKCCYFAIFQVALSLTFSSISVHCWWSPKTAKMSGVLPYLSRIFRDDSSKYFNIFCNLTWSPRMDAACKTLNCGGRTCIWISFPSWIPDWDFSIFFILTPPFLPENDDNADLCRFYRI